MGSSPAEDFLLLLLSDSNLPTGGFHFSAGLESTTKHGFLPKQSTASPSLIEPFISSSLRAHARSTLSFVDAAHSLATQSPHGSTVLDELASLDATYEAFTSNHITRRGSKTQGVGMLTLWQKAFRRPATRQADDKRSPAEIDRERSLESIMDGLKLRVRAGQMEGHMPVCWGVLCAALDLSLERTLYLHLYLHTRSILSSSVRLNQTGPYHAQSILLHACRPIIEGEISRYRSRPGMRGLGIDQVQAKESDEGEDGDEGGPASVWPLGEILQARHDVMHSRMFNT